MNKIFVALALVLVGWGSVFGEPPIREGYRKPSVEEFEIMVKAVEEGELGAFSEFVTDRKIDLDYSNSGIHLIEIAAENGHEDLIGFLIKNKVQYRLPQALKKAIQNRHITAALLLIDYDFEPTQDYLVSLIRPRSQQAFRIPPVIFKAMIQKSGPDTAWEITHIVQLRAVKKLTAIHVAALGNYGEALQYLLDVGGNPNQPVESKMSFIDYKYYPIHLAVIGAQGDNTEALDVLLKHPKTDPDVSAPVYSDKRVSTPRETALELAVNYGRISCVRRLMEHGVDPEGALVAAIDSRRMDSLLELLKNGAIKNKGDQQDAYTKALTRKQYDMASLLSPVRLRLISPSKKIGRGVTANPYVWGNVSYRLYRSGDLKTWEFVKEYPTKKGKRAIIRYLDDNAENEDATFFRLETVLAD